MELGSARWRMIGVVAALMVATQARGSVPPGDPVVAPASAAGQAGAEGDDSSENLKLTQDPSSRLTLEVLVNGRGPYAFLVDTGSDRTSISRELAASLALPLGPKVIIHESAGITTGQTVVIDRLTVGDRAIDHIEAPALAARDLGADGMLGVDALRDLHLVMDFKTLRLSSSRSRAEPADDHTIVVRGKSRYGQLILANSKIHGVPVMVVLDSGANVSIGNPALLRLLTGHDTTTAPLHTTGIVTATGRHMTLEVDQIAEAQVGGVLIRNMPLAFAQLHTFSRFGLVRRPALLLGMDVLSQCRRVTVDLHRREATFTVD